MTATERRRKFEAWTMKQEAEKDRGTAPAGSELRRNRSESVSCVGVIPQVSPRYLDENTAFEEAA
jgi:hypothetical protein